jgi:hypothetical protein
VFLYIGRVAVEKNLPAFLDLDLPGSKLVVGDGPSLAAMRRRYPQVHFAGAQFGEALVRHYAAADVMVLPSRTETFGLVLLEAMACGVPVAAFPSAGPNDVVGDSGAGIIDEDLRSAAWRMPGASAGKLRSTSSSTISPGCKCRRHPGAPRSGEPGTHMWTAPVVQGVSGELVWSLAVICPAFVCGRCDRWPRWVARIGSRT